MQCGGGSRHQQERKTAVGLGVKHRKFVALWNDRMGRIPQIVMASDLQPSLEYIQWYSSCGKPYPVADHDPEPKPEPEPEQSHSHGDSHCYHPDLAGNDSFLNLSGGEYSYKFDIFRSYP
ncbi:hypothetical protein Gotur_025984 [Gossypium turneri]